MPEINNFDLDYIVDESERESTKPKEISEDIRKNLNDYYTNFEKYTNDTNIYSYTDYQNMLEKIDEACQLSSNEIKHLKLHIDTKDKLIQELREKIESYQKILNDKKEILDKQKEEEENKVVDDRVIKLCKDCFNHETGERFESFLDRFPYEFNDENRYNRHILSKYDEKNWYYYFYISDYTIIFFCEFYANLLKNKITHHLPTDKYFEKNNNEWTECKKNNVYKVIHNEVEKYLYNVMEKTTNKYIKKYFKETIEDEWDNKKIFKENIYDNILAMTYSYNFELFKEGIINLQKTKKEKIKIIKINKNEEKLESDKKDKIINNLWTKHNSVNNFLEEILIYTDNINDQIDIKTLYNRYCLWNNKLKINITSTISFGIYLKKCNLSIKHTEKGNIYTHIKFKIVN